MLLVNRAHALAGLCGLLLIGGAVRADDRMVGITITNDNSNDILVTVYDMNTHPHSVLLVNERIAGFSSVPISIAADAGGNGHIYWSAKTADPQAIQCAQKNKSGLADGATVHVYGHSNCPLRLPYDVAHR